MRDLFTRSVLLFPLVVAALTSAPPVHADGPGVDECLAATETSLKLRSSGKLRAARAQLLICSAASCPPVVSKECVRRIDDMNTGIPTVIFTAKTVAGQELTDVKVTMDAEVVAEHLNGAALSLDPGSHQFSFEVAGEPAVIETLVLHAAEKNRHETVVMQTARDGRPLVLVPGLYTTPAPAPPPQESQEPQPGGHGAPHGLRVPALVVGGVGVAGLAVGGIFGGLAASSWSTASSECPSHTGCSPKAIDDRNTASTLATVSTAGLVAGGVLLATGATLFLIPHTASNGPAASVGLLFRPGGLAMMGEF